jgi:methyl-accepting chemotaxis protein
VNLTVRVRVGLSMTVIVGLGALTAGLAQWGLRSASRAAQARNEASLIMRGIAVARHSELAYRNGYDKTQLDTCNSTVQEIEDEITTLGTMLDDGDGRNHAEGIQPKLTLWHKVFGELVETARKKGTDKNEGEVQVVVSARENVERAIDVLKDEEVRDTMLLARIQAQSAFNTKKKEDKEKAFAEFAKRSKQILARLDVLRSDPKYDQGARGQVENEWRRYEESLGKILAYDADIARSEAQLDSLADEIEAEAKHVSVTAQKTFDKETAATNLYVFGGSIANVILAVLLGAFTIHNLNSRLRRIASGLDDGAQDLRAAASSVATTATRLAERTATQASHLEETSASIEELTATTRQNADNASSAATLAQKARRAAEQGNTSMGELHGAMKDIQESAGRIAKIIEVIKEIAFQTNLLALNAAVEAARAGEHGRGFAVVAEEVRNLAQRAAASAKETSTIIGASVQTAEKGGRIVDGVVVAQRQIVEDVQSVARLMEEIAAASREQAEGVGQINEAVVTIDKLTQQNSSAAETGAAAAEELAGQATAVSQLVGALVELVQGPAERLLAAPPEVRARARPGPDGAEAAPVPSKRVRRPGAAPGPTEATQVPSLTEDELKEF